MKQRCSLAAVLVLLSSLGCSPTDPNRNLPPIDPRTPSLKPALERQTRGGQRASDRPASVLK